MAVITISRQVGSGAYQIARLVADQMGYRLLDTELLAKLGPELGLASPGEVFDLTAELHHVKGRRERFFEVLPVNAPAYNDYLASGQASADRSFQVVSKIILAVYEQGNAVIEGRGGMCVLKNKPGVLHVRVAAPVDQRVAYVAQRDSIIPDDARVKVKQADAAQADYIRTYFAADISDPTLYHMILNTGKVRVEAAAAAICDAAAHWL